MFEMFNFHKQCSDHKQLANFAFDTRAYTNHNKILKISLFVFTSAFEHFVVYASHS